MIIIISLNVILKYNLHYGHLFQNPEDYQCCLNSVHFLLPLRHLLRLTPLGLTNHPPHQQHLLSEIIDKEQ